MRKIVINDAAHAAVLAAGRDGIPVAAGRRKPAGEWEVEVDEEVYEYLCEQARKRALSFSDIILSAAGRMQ